MNRWNEVSIEQASALLEANINASIRGGGAPMNTLLHGSPGLGKSAIVQQLADKLGAELVDVRLSAIESSDLMGIPYVDQEMGVMRFSTPTWFPEDDKLTILFLDEIGNAPVATQHAAYRLILDRTITNGKKLGDNVAIIAATNLKSDKTGARELVPAANNRFSLHLFIRPSAEATLNYMVERGFNSSLVGYLDWKKDSISKAPTTGDPAFATPRTWEMVNNHMNNPDLKKTVGGLNLLDVAIAGAVGTEVATEFAAYRELFGQVPEWEKVRSGDPKYTYEFPHNDPQLQHAVSAALAFEMLDAAGTDKLDELANLSKFLGKFHDELKVVTLKTMSRDTSLVVKAMACVEYREVYRSIQSRIK